MGRKLTEWEKKQKETNKIVQKIRKLEKFHETEMITSACTRYTTLIRSKKKALKDIEDAEDRLKEAKRVLKK